MIVHVSMAQALGIWADLCDAYHGKGWGGDVAEIYMYRLMPDCPSVNLAPSSGLAAESQAERVKNANAALFDLLSHFAETRNCRIDVYGRRLGAWLKTAGFDHRVHVKVVPR